MKFSYMTIRGNLFASGVNDADGSLCEPLLLFREDCWVAYKGRFDIFFDDDAECIEEPDALLITGGIRPDDPTEKGGKATGADRRMMALYDDLPDEKKKQLFLEAFRLLKDKDAFFEKAIGLVDKEKAFCRENTEDNK